MAKHNIYLFMDANIYLKFYSYSGVDLETLSKIAHELNDKHFKIVTTPLLKDEFYRNRESYIKQTINENFQIDLKKNFPILISNDSELHQKFTKSLKDLKAASKQFGMVCQEIIDNIKKEAVVNNLKPDILIKSIFDNAQTIELTPAIYNQSVKRMRLKNPPGKPNELGDRVHWESLLKIESDTKLVIISEDGDFASLLDTNNIKPFLKDEWQSKTNSSIEFFKDLSSFLKKYLPEFELKEQTEIANNIRLLINSLATSDSFSTTHYLIHQLNEFYPNFNFENIKSIINCYLHNSQIYMIIGDSDIYEFLSRLTRHSNYNPELNDEVWHLLDSEDLNQDEF